MTGGISKGEAMSDAIVMVLDDGETYSGIRGCMATIVDDDDVEDIERQIEDDEDRPLFFIHTDPSGMIVIQLTTIGKQRVRVI